MAGNRIGRWLLTPLIALASIVLLASVLVPLLDSRSEKLVGNDLAELRTGVTAKSPYLAEIMQSPMVDLVRSRPRYCNASMPGAAATPTAWTLAERKLCAFSEAMRSVVVNNFRDIAQGRLSINSLYVFEVQDPKSGQGTLVGVFSNRLQCEDSRRLAEQAELANKPCIEFRATPADTW